MDILRSYPRPTHISSAGLFLLMIPIIYYFGYVYEGPIILKILTVSGSLLYIVGTVLWTIDYKPKPKKEPTIKLVGEKREHVY